MGCVPNARVSINKTCVYFLLSNFFAWTVQFFSLFSWMSYFFLSLLYLLSLVMFWLKYWNLGKEPPRLKLKDRVIPRILWAIHMMFWFLFAPYFDFILLDKNHLSLVAAKAAEYGRHELQQCLSCYATDADVTSTAYRLMMKIETEWLLYLITSTSFIGCLNFCFKCIVLKMFWSRFCLCL